MGGRILKCFCENEFQDQTYGAHQRLHSLTKKDNTWRCTVCGKEQTAGVAQGKEVKVKK